MSPLFVLALIGVAVATGSLTGLTGASGMSLLISGLMLLGVDIRQVIALTFVVTLANSVASAVPYWRRGLVVRRIAVTVSVFACLGVFVGFAVGRSAPSELLSRMMIGVLFFAGLKLLSDRGPAEDLSREEAELRTWAPAEILFGLAAGIVMGVMGGGGGVFIAIVLMFGFSMAPKQAVGTSIVIMGAAAAPGLILHARQGTIPWPLVAVILPVSILAAFVAARFGREIPDRRVKQTLGCFLLVMVFALVARHF